MWTFGVARVLMAALRDLQWRRKRFTIAILGTALVFAMTLLMTGVSLSFTAEAERTVDQLGVDGWVVRAGSSGPFLGASPVAAATADVVAALPGVERAAAVLFSRKSVTTGAGEVDVNIFGAPPAGPSVPETSSGRAPDGDGEVAISTTLEGFAIGDKLTIAGRELSVVGKVERSTVLAGAPNVFVTLADAQAIGVASQPVATAIAIEGRPTGALPAGLTFIPKDEGTADVLRAVEQARSALVFMAVLLWLVAVSIVGAITYLSAIERERDFAVFKATGVAPSSITGGLALQAVLLAAAAALLGSVLALVLAPVFPMQVSLPFGAHAVLLAIGVAAGVLASLASVRRAASVDPALAFGGA